MSKYTKFKCLLEYFVAHLEYHLNGENGRGFNTYIKPLKDVNQFYSTGQGYKGGNIQKHIKDWCNYENGKVCINIQPNFGNYKTVKCYLNWEGTGLNIITDWNEDFIQSLSLEEYLFWKKPTERVHLGITKSVLELGLFDNQTYNDQVVSLFEEFNSLKVEWDYNEIRQKTMKINKPYIELLRHKPQIILQGPPGTGKTYHAKNIAEELIKDGEKLEDTKEKQADFLKNSDQFELIQFHPSYTYEDFVRGIVANEAGSYQAQDKVIAKFAKKAKENYENSKKTKRTVSKEAKAKADFDAFCKIVEKEIIENGKYPITNSTDIIDVDYDSEGFRYDGENWKTRNPYIMKFDDILTLHNLGITIQKDVETCQEVSGTARRRPTYYFTVLKKFQNSITNNNLPVIKDKDVKEKKYILIIDEINRANLPSVLGELIYALEYRNEAVESMYAKDEDRKITLPNNLYIIGTMNTADRSVGHIDYAIRRRFAFVNMLPDKSVIQNTKAITLFENVEKIFTDHISDDFQQDDVQLGHSYFLGDEDKLQMRLDYEIKPILKEYLKDGIFKESAKGAIEKLSVI